MVRKNRMKSFHSRVSDHDNPDGAKTWSRWYRYQLLSGSQLDIEEVADKVFGSRGAFNKGRARLKILAMRKSLERKSGRLLSCFHGVYSLIDPKEKGKFDGRNIGYINEAIERGNRHLHTSHHFEAYRRSVEISVKHNPRILEKARTELSLLEGVIKKAERRIVKQATTIVVNHNTRLLKRGGHKS